MALEAHVGTLLSATSTGNQSVTGVGFTPKVVIFWTEQVASDGLSTSAVVVFGIAVSSSSRIAINAISADNVGTSNSYRAHDDTNCIRFLDPDGTQDAAADFVSHDADGFTVNWSDVLSVSVTRKIHYLALGGSDITNVSLDEITSPTSTGDSAYTGPGFQPDMIIAVGASLGPAAPSGFAHAIQCIGFASGASNQGSSGWSAEDAVGTSDTDHVQLTDAVIASSWQGSLREVGEFKSFDTNGYTLTWSTVAASALRYWVLSIKGGQWEVGNETAPTSITTKASTTGFQPKMLAVCTSMSTASGSVGAHGYYGLGAATGTSNQCWAGHTDQDAAGTTIADRSVETDETIQMLDNGGTVDAEAHLDGFNSTDFTLDWTSAASSAKQFIWLVAGDDAAAPAAGFPFHRLLAGHGAA